MKSLIVFAPGVLLQKQTSLYSENSNYPNIMIIIRIKAYSLILIILVKCILYSDIQYGLYLTGFYKFIA